MGGTGKLANCGKAAASAGGEKTVFYRVRKNWEDKASQIGAFTVLRNAVSCVDLHPGYAAFDEKGRQVYPEVEGSGELYQVRVDVEDLYIRSGPGIGFDWTGECMLMEP